MKTMQVKSPEKQEKRGKITRNPDGTWPEGISGNPNGRPKGISITEMVKEALEEEEPKTGKKWKDLIIKKILVKAIAQGDTNLIKAIWAYIDGLPLSRTDITTLGEKVESPIIYKPNTKDE